MYSIIITIMDKTVQVVASFILVLKMICSVDLEHTAGIGSEWRQRAACAALSDKPIRLENQRNHAALVARLSKAVIQLFRICWQHIK